MEYGGLNVYGPRYSMSTTMTHVSRAGPSVPASFDIDWTVDADEPPAASPD
jgi:hypothetical protein